jgi:hypothetical protein
MRHGSTVVTALIGVGLAVAGFARDARSGEPLDNLLGKRLAPIVLLCRSEVQADLRLTPAQISEARLAAATLYRKALRLRGNTEAGVVAARRVVDDEQSQWLSTHLNPEQLGRLGQIDLQWEGAAAMISRPVVAEYLSLTPEQQDKVARFVAEGVQHGTRSACTYSEHVDLTRKAISVLSEKQQKLWIHVLGPACRFSIAATPAPADQPARAVPAGPRQSGR